jgi:hypothetical protein
MSLFLVVGWTLNTSVHVFIDYGATCGAYRSIFIQLLRVPSCGNYDELYAHSTATPLFLTCAHHIYYASLFISAFLADLSDLNESIKGNFLT